VDWRFQAGDGRRLATGANIKILLAQNPPGEYCRRLARRDLAWLEELLSKIVAGEKPAAQFNSNWLCPPGRLATLRARRRRAGAGRSSGRRKAARLIRNGNAALGLVELAPKSGLSPHRLSRLFKQQTGVTLVDFRNRQRVERFLEIYGRPARTMLDAALAAGFGSYPQFHRVFKRIAGCAPANIAAIYLRAS